MPIIHPEKRWKMELALEYAGTRATPEKLRRIKATKKLINDLRDITIEIAKERLKLPKGQRVISARDLIQEVVNRYYEKFGNKPPLF